MKWESGRYNCDKHHHLSNVAHAVCNGTHPSQIDDSKSKKKKARKPKQEVE